MLTEFIKQEITNIFKKIRKYWFFFTLIPIVFIVLVVILIVLVPILVLYSMFPFIFGLNPQFFGVDLKEASKHLNMNVNQKYDMGIISDSKEFEFKVAIDRKSVIDCGTNSNFKDQPVDCFTYLDKETGKIHVPKNVQEVTASGLFPDVPENAYLGVFPSVITQDIELPTVYHKNKKVARFKKSGSAAKQDEEITYDYVFIEKLYGECKEYDDYVCEVVRQGKTAYPFITPSFKGLERRYGYYKDLSTFSTVEFNDYVLFKGDPSAITNATVKEMDAGHILLVNHYGSHTLEMLYEGNFSLFDTKDYFYYQEPLAISIDNSFKLTTKLDGKHFNPLLLFKSGIYIQGMDIKTEFDEKYVTGKYVVKREAIENRNLLDQVSFKQPFGSLTITQLAKVPGASDGGKTLHGAIDMIPNASSSIDLPSAISGVVFESGYDDWSGYYITIEDPTTKLRVNYSHLKQRSIYSKGAFVNQGDILGQMGNTGRSFGDHLHMQVTVPQADGGYAWIDFIDYLTNYSIYNTWQ